MLHGRPLRERRRKRWCTRKTLTLKRQQFSRSVTTLVVCLPQRRKHIIPKHHVRIVFILGLKTVAVVMQFVSIIAAERSRKTTEIGWVYKMYLCTSWTHTNGTRVQCIRYIILCHDIRPSCPHIKNHRMMCVLKFVLCATICLICKIVIELSVRTIIFNTPKYYPKLKLSEKFLLLQLA